MNCLACRNALPEEAVYCPECGEKITEQRPASLAVGAAARQPSTVGAGTESADRRPAAEGHAAAAEPLSSDSVETTGAKRAGGGEMSSTRPVAAPSPGRPVAPSQSRPVGAPPRRSTASVEALLGRANLLRMRGQWAEAVERCTEALRADPHSAAAHSLLGDIYENQGRLDKASHWYQLALEQNPESIADKAKLARVRELQAVRRRTGDPRFSWAYLVAVAGVAFLFVAFVMAAIVAGDRNRGASGVNAPVANEPMPEFPASAPPRMQPLDHTDEEENLANALIGQLGSLYVTPVTVTLDPAESEAFITVRMTKRPLTPDPMGGGRRDHLLREGYRIAYLARDHQRAQQRPLRVVTVRALDRLNNSAGSMANKEIWRGRILVTRLAVSDDRASVPEVRSVYDQVYWNPFAGF